MNNYWREGNIKRVRNRIKYFDIQAVIGVLLGNIITRAINFMLQQLDLFKNCPFFAGSFRNINFTGITKLLNVHFSLFFFC